MRIDRESPSQKQLIYAASFFVGMTTSLAGCGGEPSQREIQNARAFETLLTAVSLKHGKEIEKDAAVIEERHSGGEISDGNYRELSEIIAKARAKDWPGAERRAYEFRSRFGDRGSFFK